MPPVWKPEITVGKHLTGNGVKPFSVRDEWHYHERIVDGMQGVTPTLSAVVPLRTMHFDPKDGKPCDRGGNADVVNAVQNKEPQVLAWAYDRRGEGGRGFGFTGFHFYDNLADDSFRTTLLNGAAWVSGLQVPEGGVPSETPGKEELAGYLYEAHPDVPVEKLK